MSWSWGMRLSGLQNWENAADPSHRTSFPRGPFVSVAAHTVPPTAEACFSSRFLKKQQRVKLNGSLWALPILTITASPSGNVITHHISQTTHILKRCVFWCATDHFQMQQTEFRWAKVARNQASPHWTQYSETFHALRHEVFLILDSKIKRTHLYSE